MQGAKAVIGIRKLDGEGRARLIQAANRVVQLGQAGKSRLRIAPGLLQQVAAVVDDIGVYQPGYREGSILYIAVRGFPGGGDEVLRLSNQQPRRAVLERQKGVHRDQVPHPCCRHHRNIRSALLERIPLNLLAGSFPGQHFQVHADVVPAFKFIQHPAQGRPSLFRVLHQGEGDLFHKNIIQQFLENRYRGSLGVAVVSAAFFGCENGFAPLTPKRRISPH